MENLTNAQPKQFLKEDGLSIRRLQTRSEKFFGETLPHAGQYLSYLAKAAILAPLLGGPLVAVPFAIVVSTALIKFSRQDDKKNTVEKQPEDYELSDHGDRSAFKYHYGRAQPHFVDDYLKLCKEIGFEKTPHVYFSNVKKVRAAATQKTTAGEVLFSEVMFRELDREELNAVTAHELVHVRLGHVNKSNEQNLQLLLSQVMNVVLVVSAVFTPLPLLPVLCATIALSYAEKACNSITQRSRENVCDRGAALLTGSPEKVKSALNKAMQLSRIHKNDNEPSFKEKVMKKILPADTPTIRSFVTSLIKKNLPEHIAKPILSMRAKFIRFVQADHPSLPVRENQMDNFDNKYPAFCESKRGTFKNAFNRVATRPQLYQEASFSANRLKTNNNFKS